MKFLNLTLSVALLGLSGHAFAQTEPTNTTTHAARPTKDAVTVTGEEDDPNDLSRGNVKRTGPNTGNDDKIYTPQPKKRTKKTLPSDSDTTAPTHP
jgi:hypothetical protein